MSTSQDANIVLPRAADVLDRLAKAYGVPSDAELARRLGIPKTTLSSKRQRDSVPYEECVRAMRETNARLEWLLLGEGHQERIFEDRLTSLKQATLLAYETNDAHGTLVTEWAMPVIVEFIYRTQISRQEVDSLFKILEMATSERFWAGKEK